MDLNTLLIVLIRWTHLMAVVTWVGGNIFYLAVLRPAMRAGETPRFLGRQVGAEFKGVVETALWVLLVTGVLLLTERLSVVLSVAYGVILALKLALFGVMAIIALALGRGGPRRTDSPLEAHWLDILPQGISKRLHGARSRLGRLLTPTNLLTVLGPIIIFLSILLRFLSNPQ